MSLFYTTLERLVDVNLRKTLDGNILSRGQHAYNKGRSVETALHSLVCRIEKSLAQKEYTPATFLDIEGAFNNVELCAITGALERLGVQTIMVNWISKLLCGRTI